MKRAMITRGPAHGRCSPTTPRSATTTSPASATLADLDLFITDTGARRRARRELEARRASRVVRGMIVTLTLNPSLDRTIEVAVPRAGCGDPGRVGPPRPGGKGVNVARALLANGVDARAVVPSAATRAAS